MTTCVGWGHSGAAHGFAFFAHETPTKSLSTVRPRLGATPERNANSGLPNSAQFRVLSRAL